MHTISEVLKELSITKGILKQCQKDMALLKPHKVGGRLMFTDTQVKELDRCYREDMLQGIYNNYNRNILDQTPMSKGVRIKDGGRHK